jgi:hypothetical protein
MERSIVDSMRSGRGSLDLQLLLLGLSRLWYPSTHPNDFLGIDEFVSTVSTARDVVQPMPAKVCTTV